MKLLIVGRAGQLGQYLVRQARVRGIDFTAVESQQCDITDPQSVRCIFKEAAAVDVVINAAAYTDVDRAESESDKAFSVNAHGAGNLARVCAEHGATLIHVSTDYVFDGALMRPYLPTDPVHPLGVYGQSKAAGEAAVKRELDRHAIVRTSWLFGACGRNFVKTMLRLGRRQDELQIVDDQVGCPTYAGDLAGALIDAAWAVHQNKVAWGIYHYCNEGALTWYAFARRIFPMAKTYTRLRTSDIHPILTHQFPRPAPRPRYSVLDCTSFERAFQVRRRSWEEGLREVLQEIYIPR